MKPMPTYHRPRADRTDLVAVIAFLIALPVGVAAGDVKAQRFLGPRYPDEQIISERIISPATPVQAATAQPSSNNSDSSGLSVLLQQQQQALVDREPVSLSDSRGRANEVDFSDPSMFAMGHQVWQKMLELERGNADLQASFEYERKLATYRERHEDFQTAQTAEIERLESQIKSLRHEKEQLVRESSREIAALVKESQAKQNKIQSLSDRVAQLQSDRPLDHPQKKAAPDKQSVATLDVAEPSVARQASVIQLARRPNDNPSQPHAKELKAEGPTADQSENSNGLEAGPLGPFSPTEIPLDE